MVAETVTPGIGKPKVTKEKVTRPVMDEHGRPKQEIKFVGLQSYLNVLELDKARDTLFKGNWLGLLDIDFFKALRFTLTFTLITLPLAVILGLTIAVCVNSLIKA